MMMMLLKQERRQALLRRTAERDARLEMRTGKRTMQSSAFGGEL